MYALIYENKTSGEVILECCFASYEEKRRDFLLNQEDINFREKRTLTGLYAFFACMFHKRYVVDRLPSSPKGEYRI